jgi:hypothetical protein
MKKEKNIIINFQLKEINYTFNFKRKIKLKKKDEKKNLKNRVLNNYLASLSSIKKLCNIYNFIKNYNIENLLKIQYKSYYYLNSNINKWKKKFKKITIPNIKILNFNKYKYKNIYLYNSTSLNIKLNTFFFLSELNKFYLIDFKYEEVDFNLDYLQNDKIIYNYIYTTYILYKNTLIN